MQASIAHQDLAAGEPPCRSITAEEIAHYHEFGWVKLKGFVQVETAQSLLSIAREHLGENGDNTRAPGGIEYFTSARPDGMGDPVIRPVIEAFGRTAKVLMKRQPHIGVRYFMDAFIPKLPACKPARNGGNGPTSFHQDWLSWSLDRTGGMTFWIALGAFGGEAGTMSFINHSHRAGVFPDYRTWGDGDLLDLHPELREDMTEPMTYAPGDVTIHSGLTVHGASTNMTDTPRWCYIVLVQPEDACWTGMPTFASESSVTRAFERLDDEHFPVIA